MPSSRQHLVAERGLRFVEQTHFVHELRKKFVNRRPVRKFKLHERPILHERTVRRVKVPKAELIAKTKPVELDRDILNITEEVVLPIPRESSRLTERGHLLRLGTLKPPTSEQTQSSVADLSPIGSINTVKRIVRERIKPSVRGQSTSIGIQTAPPNRTNQATQTVLSFNLPAIIQNQYGSLGKGCDHRISILCHEFLQQVQAIYNSSCSIPNQATQSIVSNRLIHSNTAFGQPTASPAPVVCQPDFPNNSSFGNFKIVQRPVVNYYTTEPPIKGCINSNNSTNLNQQSNHPYAGLTRNQIKRIKYLERKSKRIDDFKTPGLRF